MEENNSQPLTPQQELEFMAWKVHQAVSTVLCVYPPDLVATIIASLAAGYVVQFGDAGYNEAFRIAQEHYSDALAEMRQAPGYEQAVLNKHTPLPVPAASFNPAPQFIYPVPAPANTNPAAPEDTSHIQ